jgi:hypothetical protein
MPTPYPDNPPSNQFLGQLFNRLVNLDAQQRPIPELAEIGCRIEDARSHWPAN